MFGVIFTGSGDQDCGFGVDGATPLFDVLLTRCASDRAQAARADREGALMVVPNDVKSTQALVMQTSPGSSAVGRMHLELSGSQVRLAASAVDGVHV